MGDQTASSTSEQQIKSATLLNGPAGTPPAGVQSNFDNPANLNTIIYLTKTIALTLTTVAIFIRIYTRHVIIRSLGYDDYTSILAWLSLIGYAALSLVATSAGAGVHIWDIRLGAFFGLLHWVNMIEIFYGPVYILIKVSILLQYSRVFNPTGKNDLRMFIAIQLSIWTIASFYFILIFFNTFQCNPRENIWNKLAFTGHCYNIEAIRKATGVFNVISDFAILLLPLSSIWKLRMERKKKLLVSAVFAIGFLACLTSILRTYYSWKLGESPDTSRLLAVNGLCGDIELSVGILIGCFPVMPKFFQHVGPKISKALSFRSKSTSSLSYAQKARSRTPPTDTVAKSKNPFAKYKVGSSVFESCVDPYDQMHSEYYTLNESDAS